ncbi:MAG: hypothetical protein LBS84_04475 [Clostridiales bacterium]|jgi:hypothetical protein|nr:hypothetical protein [Clostridiales bacterium]
MCRPSLTTTGKPAPEVEPPVISDLKIYYADGELSASLEFNITIPDSAKQFFEYGFFLVDEVSLDGGEWESLGFDGDNKENGIRRTYPTTLNADTVVKYRVRYQYWANKILRRGAARQSP